MQCARDNLLCGLHLSTLDLAGRLCCTIKLQGKGTDCRHRQELKKTICWHVGTQRGSHSSKGLHANLQSVQLIQVFYRTRL